MTIITSKTCTCLKCFIEKPRNQFYINAGHPLLSEKFEVFPLCKVCLKEFSSNMSKFMNNDYVGIIMLCSMMNKPFNFDQWSESGSNHDLGDYLRQLNSLPQWKGKTFGDSDLFKEEYQELNEQVEYSPSDIAQLIEFWGRYEPKEYEYLENEYRRFLNSYQIDGYAGETIIREICKLLLVIKKKLELGQDTSKDYTTLRNLMTDANIKPVQESGANATEQATLGTLIKRLETERPVPKANPEWEDVDGIRRYISIWFFGHLCHMLGMKNKYAQMYEEELQKHTVETEEMSSSDGDS